MKKKFEIYLGLGLDLDLIKLSPILAVTHIPAVMALSSFMSASEQESNVLEIVNMKIKVSLCQ